MTLKGTKRKKRSREILLKVPIDRSVPPVLQIILAVIPPLPGSIHHLLQGDDKSHEPQ